MKQIAMHLARWSIKYDPHDHLFAVVVDGREIGRAASYIEGEMVRDAFFRTEDALRQIKLPEGRRAFTVSEVAEALGVKEAFVREQINSGNMAAFRTSERGLRVSAQALEDWIAAQEQKYRNEQEPDMTILVPRGYTQKTQRR